MNCIYCGLDLETIHIPKNRGNHIRWCTKNPKRKIKLKICPVCGIEYLSRNKSCDKVECKKIVRKHTDETKKIISEKRKTYLNNNKNKHNWSLYKNEESQPELLFKKNLMELNIGSVQYYIPPENDRYYELDFAIPELKIAYEINGNQHYNKNGTLKEYYQERHDYFILNGWSLFEIHYLLCFNDIEIKKIINDSLIGQNKDIIENKNIECLNWTLERREKALKKKKDDKIKSKEKKLCKYNVRLLKIEKRKKIILNSDIDFNKFGWVSEISNLLNMKSQKVGYWMKEHMPEIYEIAFKRKSSQNTHM